MDQVKNIMERLGFNADGEDSVKAAFIKNLIKQAYGVDVAVPPQYMPEKPHMTKEGQMIFDIEGIAPAAPNSKPKAV